jgi:hypothetical protein
MDDVHVHVKKLAAKMPINEWRRLAVVITDLPWKQHGLRPSTFQRRIPTGPVMEAFKETL